MPVTGFQQIRDIYEILRIQYFIKLARRFKPAGFFMSVNGCAASPRRIAGSGDPNGPGPRTDVGRRPAMPPSITAAFLI
jgi:hypothetical protein